AGTPRRLPAAAGSGPGELPAAAGAPARGLPAAATGGLPPGRSGAAQWRAVASGAGPGGRGGTRRLCAGRGSHTTVDGQWLPRAPRPRGRRTALLGCSGDKRVAGAEAGPSHVLGEPA